MGSVRKIISRVIAHCLPDKLYLTFKFRSHMGYWMDWNNPQTFCEKIQWLKIFNRRKEFTSMVDKIEAKKYVASIIGEEYIIPTIAIYNNVEEIDFDKLPNQFVLKCTSVPLKFGIMFFIHFGSYKSPEIYAFYLQMVDSQDG